jgi:hypothetical protein
MRGQKRLSKENTLIGQPWFRVGGSGFGVWIGLGFKAWGLDRIWGLGFRASDTEPFPPGGQRKGGDPR